MEFHSKPDLNIESIELFHYFWISLILSIPIVLLSMGIFQSIPVLISSWLQFIFATPVVIWCGLPILKRNWISIAERRFNMFTLIAMAIMTAYCYGVIALLLPNVFPAILNINADSDFLFEIAAVMTSIILLEQIFEDRIWRKIKSTPNFSMIESNPPHYNYFVIIVVSIAILTIFFSPDINDGIISAIAVLAIACPRAMTLAKPIAILSGIELSEKLGVQMSNAACLEQLEKVKVIVIDKDSISEESTALAIKKLHDENIRIVLVTSEEVSTAKEDAKKYGIEIIETETSPQQKKEVAQRLIQQGFVVAMITNTTNNNGIILEFFSSSGNHESNIRFMKNDLMDVVRVLELSIKVMRDIRQNKFIANLYNIICIPLAAGFFYFWTGEIFNPITAAVMMFFCIVCVSMNALRLQKIKLLS